MEDEEWESCERNDGDKEIEVDKQRKVVKLESEMKTKKDGYKKRKSCSVRNVAQTHMIQ